MCEIKKDDVSVWLHQFETVLSPYRLFVQHFITTDGLLQLIYELFVAAASSGRTTAAKEDIG